MTENADTSASAASSGDGSSPLAASGAEVPWPGRVDFYVLEEPSSSGRLKVACKLAEKAYLSAQTVLVWHTDPAELRAFDEMLWTFNDGSFVPHEVLLPTGDSLAGRSVAASDCPVLLSLGVAPSANVDIVINLSPELPTCLSQTRRVAEIIDGDDTRRRAGRARFKAYRELGVQPASHNIRGD
jgi:DNA polymerase III subunit chi